MTSFWRTTSPPIETDGFEPRAHVDAVVVGAGFTGLVTAVLLGRTGARVVLLEARTVGDAASGNTIGKISLLQGTVLGDLRHHAGDDVLRAYVEANRAGQEWMRGELGALGVAVEERDAYTYAITPEGDESVARELEAAAFAGLDVSPSTDIGLPFAVASAIRLAGQAQLHAMEALAALTAEARRLGVRVVEGVRVLGVDAGSPCAVQTSLGGVTADRVILATGVPILDRGLFFAKVEAVRSYAAAYELTSADVVPRGMYLSADEPRRSVRTTPVAGGELLITGGGGHVTGRSDDTDAEVDALDRWTSEHWPRAHRIARWSAQDHRTHTRVPFAGALPRSAGRVFAATGYNKWGLTNAVAAAMTITGHVVGDVPDWASTLASDRPGAADVAETISSNAEVAGHLVGDWAKLPATPRDTSEPPAEGQGIVRHDGLRPVAVATVDGRTCRVSGVCTHLGGVLAWNSAEQSWDCPLHGSRFDAEGAVLEGPAVDDLATMATPSTRAARD